MSLMSLCDNKHKFVFEIAPNVFKPDTFDSKLSSEELEYWTAFSLIKNAQSYGIKTKKLTFDETVEQINAKERELNKEKTPSR